MAEELVTEAEALLPFGTQEKRGPIQTENVFISNIRSRLLLVSVLLEGVQDVSEV